MLQAALVSPRRAYKSIAGGGSSDYATGEILVRDFKFSLQMPRLILGYDAENDPGTPSRQGRTSSFGISQRLNTEKREAYYMIAMTLDVPLSGLPPDSPYMVRHLHIFGLFDFD